MGLMDKRRELLAEKDQAELAEQAIAAPQAHSGVQYRVEQLRETLIGDKIDTSAMQSLMNQRASEGWLFRQAIETSVKGRVGPGGTGGLVLIFERPA